ncbi:MAG TPA: hypothetical protein VHF69_09125, partial [Candidatus Synoicihabitans sp.]|nr:hypothetical protein [Candidatus Synoicihabitans sp.]
NTANRTNPLDNGGSAAFTHMTNLPDNRFGPQLAGSRLELPGPRSTMIPDTPLFVEETQGVHLNFTHKFSRDLFFEVQADANRVEMDMVAPNTILGSRNLFIDINRHMPNGALNPHFLDAYSQGNIEKGFRRTDNMGLRAALAYRKDLGKWGDYSFNLSAMVTQREVDYRRYILALPLNSDPRDWHAYPVQYRYYQHDTARPFEPPSTATTFFNRTAVAGTGGADNSYTTSTSTLAPRWVLSNIGGQGAEERKERNESFTFAFAGRYFDNKLIISPGVRVSYQDTDLRWARIAPGWGALPNDPAWDGVTLDDRYWRPDAPADWKDLTWTPRDAAGNPLVSAPVPSGWTARPRRLVAGTRDVFEPDPLYANDRFRDDYNRPKIRDQETVNTTVGLTYHLRDWVALKLSYGTSFLPPDVGRWELTGDDAKAETGVAYEAAVTFSLFNDRLAVTPRYYFNRRENALTGSPATTSIDNLVRTRAWNDPLPGTRNPFNYPDVNGNDYFAQYNDGYELEVAGEIMRGWRLSASFGTARVVDYDRWPQTQAYILSR